MIFLTAFLSFFSIFTDADSKVICFFINPKILNLTPEGLEYPDIQCCQTSYHLRTTFFRCNCVPFQRRCYNCWSQLIYAHPIGRDTLRSHLKLNQVKLLSSVLEANETSSAKWNFQPNCKTIDYWSSIPQQMKFTPLQVSFFFYHNRHDGVQKSYAAFNNQVKWKIILSNANWTGKENPKYLKTTEQSECTLQPIPFPYQ